MILYEVAPHLVGWPTYRGGEWTQIGEVENAVVRTIGTAKNAAVRKCGSVKTHMREELAV